MTRVLHDDRPPVEHDLARIEVVGAEDGPCDLGASAPDEPGEADDLSRPDRERDVLEVAPAGSRRTSTTMGASSGG